ncbi:uncharacterized protein L3040_002817 [Drepanopeziza brunnea f. sp. 'multigermtubi']|uniref:Nap family protein n=1 Tax=Marssonina brunnea f. sp. multigermtubi (strain MB_m1) TaxID=1072389 RepID=K1X1R7_MARBU|nr:nap family protein [Drepanopeziza brunnea f. sp. 'multigermtubi' MB_m1]EKD14753.1 nap family protein [Drepanopeziza brunnea f. sp. 'multigermtubi' MB_m1]KAJ5050950.1 hypothetical protein L3040_002817 [Drepanopeziza brunnea f. sp. 'multigermtubi']
MAAALEDTPVSYEDLAEIEREFDQVETEIIRQQLALTKHLYARRSKTVAQIPNFWPLVLEQAPPDIDQYIQPSDSALLLSSLASLSVSHFEAELPHGDPRSVSIRFDFQENEYFRDASLEKRFWWRRATDGWTGLVSEPVPIDWKAGRDLTGGVLGLVVKAWEAERKSSSSVVDGGGGGGAAKDKKKKKAGLTPEQKALKKHIDGTGMGGLSFFAWFGFIGRNITAEESAAANALEARRREARKAGSAHDTDKDGDGEKGEQDTETEDTEGEDEVDMSLEIFPEGDDLAVAISEDLWPSAIKYFTQAQEQDALSDADFESDDDEEKAGDEEEAGDEEPAALSAGENSDADAELARPKKKQRSS